MREVAAFSMRGPYQCMALAGLFGLIGMLFSPLVLLGTAALGLATLRYGVRSGISVAGGAIVPVLIGWFVLPISPTFGFPIVLLLWPIALVGAEILRRTESQANALVWVGTVCALLVIGFHLMTGDPSEFWQEEHSQAALSGLPAADPEDLRSVGAPPRLLGGLLGMLLLAASFSSLLLARWWQSLLYNPGAFAVEFRKLRFPQFILPACAVLLFALSNFDVPLMDDLFVIAMAMFMFAGLAVVHHIVQKRRLSPFWVLPAYIALVVAAQAAVVILAFVGAADVLMNFRTLPKR